MLRSVKSSLIFAFFVVGVQIMALSQCTVKGALYDDDNGEAIPFANVVLEGTNYGVSTDINGFFLINKVPEGTYVLKVRYVGYDEYRDTIKLVKGRSVTKTIKLKTAATVLDAVVITDSKSEERKVQTQVSVEKITASQIQQMPSIGGQADLAQYLQVLPGVNSTGDQGGQLYIRGGSMIQNLCLLDGMIVYNPFHSIGLYSIFETDVILNADVYTGGFGAQYGGRLSSVMDITTRDGNRKRHSGKVGVNTFGANLILEGPLKKESANSSSTITYLLTAKNSYLSKSSEYIYPYIDGGLPFDFLDLYGKLTASSGTGSKISVFGFRFDDQVKGYQGLNDYHWRNFGAGTNFALVTGSSALVEGSVAYSNYNITLNDLSGKEKYSSIGGFNMSLVVNNFYGKNKLTYGLSMENYSTDYQYYNAMDIRSEQEEHTNDIAGFITYKYCKDKWLFDAGLRFVYYNSLNEGSPEPRLAIKFNATDKLRFKFAGGLYSQIFLDARSDNDIVNLFNGFLTGSGTLNKPHTFLGDDVTGCVQRAQHLIFGAEFDALEHLTLNAELYFKNFSQLLNSNHNRMYDRSDPVYSNPNSEYYKPEYLLTDYVVEQGKAYGLDVSLCYDLERLYLWATYSLGYVKRTDEAQTYYPHYDRRHTINLLATYALGKQREWEFSARWSYGSGFPFTQTQGVFEQQNPSSIDYDFNGSNGQMGLYYADYNGGRLPAYHRFDAGVKRKFSIGKRSVLELNLSATNVYNRSNIFYFDRVTFDRVNQLPVLVCFGVNFSF